MFLLQRLATLRASIRRSSAVPSAQCYQSTLSSPANVFVWVPAAAGDRPGKGPAWHRATSRLRPELTEKTGEKGKPLVTCRDRCVCVGGARDSRCEVCAFLFLRLERSQAWKREKSNAGMRADAL